MENRISGRRAAVVASLLLAGAASAKPLVWWTMANDAADGGSNIVATTTFTNCASAANEFYGKIGKGSKFTNNFLLPVPTNGFEHPFLLQDGVFGVPAENAFAIDIPSDPDRPGDNLWGASLSPYDPEGKLNCPSFTIEFFFRTKKWTNWHGLIVKPYYDGEGENTNTIAIREVSYSQTNTTLVLDYLYREDGRLFNERDVFLYSSSYPSRPSSAPVIQDGNWHHIAITVDQPTRQLCAFIDGERMATVALKGDLAYSEDPSVPWCIGGNPNANWAWGGTIDEVRFHDRALAPSEFLRRVDTLPPPATLWQTGASGLWGEAANWSGGVPTASRPGWIIQETETPITVSVAAETAGPGQLYLRNSGSRTTLAVDAPLAFSAADVALFEGGAVTVGDGGVLALDETTAALAPLAQLVVAPGGLLRMRDAALTADSGATLAVSGRMDVAGGSMALVGAGLEIAGEMALENSTFTTSGRVRIPAGATLAFTNDAANTFRFLPNASLEIDGGTVDVGGEGSSLPFRLDAGSALHVTGTGALKLAGKKTVLTARSETFSGQAQLTTYHVDVTAVGNNATNTLTLRDEALWTTVNDGAWTLGTSRHGNSCVVVNLESRQPVRIPYGVVVGAVQNAVLNLHKGQFLSGGGNVNGVGYACGDTAVTGVVNVVDGVFMQRSCAQYKKWLYGITVGDSMRTELTTHPNAYGRGTLNIHANGIVSNLTSYAGYGYGLYLRVGSGRGEGDINQMGGAFYHSGRYQAVLGLWGGTGRWTLTSNATARVCSDVYVGGSLTNLLCGFVEGKNVGASPEFMSTFDVDDHTAKGTLSVVSGTFLSPSNLFVSVDGTGTLVLGEDPAARLVARNVVLSNTVDAARGARYPSTLKFVFGAEGCGRLVCGAEDGAGVVQPTGRLIVSPGSKLEVDLSALRNRSDTWHPLVACAELEGSFAPSDVTVTPPADGSLCGSLFVGTHKGVNGLWWVIQRGAMIIIR